MAKTIDEIRRIKDYYTGDLYVALRAEQSEDQSYIEDSFAVPEVRAPHKVIRSGIGYQVVSAPGEQIITANPQAFVSVALKTNEKSADNMSREINENWIYNLKRQLPNIFKESVKNKLARGESYIKVVHNELWVTGKQLRYGMPVIFMAPDPMVIYGSPEEDDCGWTPNIGVPNAVVVFYERQPLDVVARYPSWENPDKKEKKDMVQWFEYWDKDVRYFEANGVAMLKGGVQPNPYGFVPFVRKYSGFGKRSPQGRLQDLIVSDIRRSRDLIKQECAIRSDIASIMHMFAHKPITIVIPDTATINEEALKNLDFGEYALNILPLPESTITKVDYGLNTILPSPEAFQHLRDIRSDIQQRHPFIMSGFPLGTSGRQQDISQMAAMRRFDTIVENTEDEFATAFEMGMKICNKIPSLRPDSLRKVDLTIDYKCEVKLKAEDPIEQDRLATLGSRLYGTDPTNRQIDLKTNLVQYQGYTPEKADEIIDDMLVDMITFGSPEVAELMALKVAEKAGMREELALIKEAQQQAGGGTTPTEARRSRGETKTGTGREMIDEALRNRGARKPPERYFRGSR